MEPQLDAEHEVRLERDFIEVSTCVLEIIYTHIYIYIHMYMMLYVFNDILHV